MLFRFSLETLEEPIAICAKSSLGRQERREKDLGKGVWMFPSLKWVVFRGFFWIILFKCSLETVEEPLATCTKSSLCRQERRKKDSGKAVSNNSGSSPGFLVLWVTLMLNCVKRLEYGLCEVSWYWFAAI